MKAPEMEKGIDTKEKQKITTNPGAVDIKLDDKLTGPTPYTHFSSEKSITKEDVRGELQHIRNSEDAMHKKELLDFRKKVIQAHSAADRLNRRAEQDQVRYSKEINKFRNAHHENLGIKIEEVEYYEINEEKPYHTHVAHFENKDGEWMAKLLINADHDGHAIDQANEASGKGPFGGLNVRKVERVTKVMEEVEELDEAMDTRSDVPAYLRKARGDKPLSHDEVRAKKHDTRSAPGNVKMSPLERVRGLADLSMKRMKKENLIGSAGATSESFEEEVENINEESLLDKYISSIGMDPDHVPRSKKIGIARSASFLAWVKRFV
jgi:hypothetical protein